MPSDAIATMGTILPETASGRDAVHVAVIVVTAQEILHPGQHVSKDGRAEGARVGIVDPFLTVRVYPGQRYWMYLYPRTITSLRHEWAHPDFVEEATSPPPTEAAAPDAAIAVSEQWLRDFCSTGDCPGYYEVLATAEAYLDSGEVDESLYFEGSDAHGYIPPDFWTHVCTILRRPMPSERPTYFSCSC